MTLLLAMLHSAIGQGAITGLVTAAAADYAVFRQWKSWEDARTYDWGIASFRWVQGSIVGALTGAGLGWV